MKTQRGMKRLRKNRVLGTIRILAEEEEEEGISWESPRFQKRVCRKRTIELQERSDLCAEEDERVGC
jgi:hypothetical protein